MRNTVLALVAAGSITFAALSPALAVGITCPDYPNMERCPIDGVYGNPTPRPSYQAPRMQIRHAQGHHDRYRFNG